MGRLTYTSAILLSTVAFLFSSSRQLHLSLRQVIEDYALFETTSVPGIWTLAGLRCRLLYALLPAGKIRFECVRSCMGSYNEMTRSQMSWALSASQSAHHLTFRCDILHRRSHHRPRSTRESIWHHLFDTPSRMRSAQAISQFADHPAIQWDHRHRRPRVRTDG